METGEGFSKAVVATLNAKRIGLDIPTLELLNLCRRSTGTEAQYFWD